MAAAGTELYIYYRLQPGALQALLPALRDMQAALAVSHGCRAALRQRADDDTVMEIYAGLSDPEALLEAIDRQLVRIGFDRHLAPAGRRHVERFECV
ncbi:MAG: DUF4936 family protein [Rhodocyclaceae bacterium]|nr:DUF4936 family protein [Rhodocyclaceae bacterium]